MNGARRAPIRWVLATGAVVLASAVVALQYLHLSNEISAGLAFAALLAAAGLRAVVDRQKTAASEEAARPAKTRILEIDPAATLGALRLFGVTSPPGGVATTSRTPRFAGVKQQINAAARRLPWVGVRAAPAGLVQSTAPVRPPYVERAIDARLRAAVREKPFVVLVGRSKDGKSRAMYEALAAEFPHHKVIVPPRPTTDRDALRRIGRPEFRIGSRTDPTILWLDDLDDFLATGALNWDTLTALQERESPRLKLVASIRSEQFGARTLSAPEARVGTESSIRNSFDEAARILQEAHHEFMPRDWTQAESEAARQKYPDVPFDPQLGLGALLVGGPELAQRLALGPTWSPAGFAVSLAAIDARRAGVSRALARGELERIWNIYSEARAGPPSKPNPAFEEGLTWACEPTPSGLPLVSRTADGYLASDYAVSLRSGERPGGPIETLIRSDLWEALVEILPPVDAFELASGAYASGALKYTELALEKATTAPVPSIVALSWYKLGTLRVRDLSRITEGIEALDEVERRFGQATEPPLRAVVANALLSKGVALADTDLKAEVRTYDEVISRYAEAPEPELRTAAAGALFNKGLTLQSTDAPGSTAAYDELIARFGAATEASIRESVASAMLNKAANETTGPAHVTGYDELITRFGEVPDREVRWVVAKALVNKGVALGESDPSAARALYDRVIAEFDSSSEPKVRLDVARARLFKGQDLSPSDLDAAVILFEKVVTEFADGEEPEGQRLAARAVRAKAVALRTAGDLRAATATYDELIARYDTTRDREVLEQVVDAMLNKGSILGPTDPLAAIALSDAIVARFGDAPELGIRSTVALATWNRGQALDAIGSPDVGAAWDEMEARFGKEPGPVFREHVAAALLNKSALVGSTDPAAGIEICEKIVRDYGDAPQARLRLITAMALSNKAQLLSPGDAKAGAEAYEELLARYGDAPDPELLRLVAEAREALAAGAS